MVAVALAHPADDTLARHLGGLLTTVLADPRPRERPAD
jgi:hypothetical protein